MHPNEPESVSVVATKDGRTETFLRPTLEAAQALAGELEKEGRSITIDGVLFLNTAGPDGRYLHQSADSCPMCSPHGYVCARCESGKGEYYSVKPTHYHSHSVEGVTGYQSIHDLLCYACHRKDRFEVYGPTYGEEAA